MLQTGVAQLIKGAERILQLAKTTKEALSDLKRGCRSNVNGLQLFSSRVLH